MKTPGIRVILLSGVFLLSGCASYGPQLDRANGYLIESARSYVNAADKELPDHPDRAKKHLGYAKEVLGPPAEDLDDDELEARHKHDAEVIADRERAKQKLVDLGRQKEIENNKNLISRIWHWGIATIGIGGVIAVCFLFPPLIPVLLQLLGHIAIWWFSHFPAIIGAVWRGVSAASSEVYTAIKNSHPKLPPPTSPI